MQIIEKTTSSFKLTAALQPQPATSELDAHRQLRATQALRHSQRAPFSRSMLRP
jgi:hypothetical protein